MPDAGPSTLSPSGPPTSIRRQIVGWATLMSLLLYLDRFCISICTGYIRQDLDVSLFLVSWLSSAFFFTYALFQVPSGWLTDKYGVRVMLTLFILGWSLCTGLQAFVQSFALLAVLQLLCGAAQAGAYPAGARLVREWNPPTTRGMGSALVALGGRVGGGIAPILTATLMILFVPTSTDSRVTPATDLSPLEMSKKLRQPKTERPIDAQLTYLRGLLTSEEQSLVISLSKVADLNDELQSQKLPGVTLILQDPTPEQTEQSRNLLNRLMDSSTLYRPELFDLTMNEREGRKLARKKQELNARGEELPPDELRRLNRLTLESVFPKELGNIYVFGWRPSMLVYGGAGLLFAAIFWWQIRNTPPEHPGCNLAERNLIQIADPPPHATAAPVVERFPWRGLLMESSMWGNCLLQVTTNIGWLFLVRTMPQYLEEVHGVPLVMRGVMTSVPIWAGVVGVYFGGRLADGLVQKIGLKWGRRLPIVITRATGALGYALCIALNYLVPAEHAPPWMPWVYVASLSLIAISTDLGVPSVWAFAQDVGGKYTASVLGWGNMWGNLGAALATPYYAAVLTYAKQAGWAEWNTLFLLNGLIYLLGALGGWVMDPTKPLNRTVAKS